MPAAVLASLTRSGRVESVHRGSVAVAGADGELVASAGAPSEPCFFRSACKPLQLVPAIECRAAEELGLGDRHLAVMVSSHSGAPRHLEAVREILDAIKLEDSALACGYHPPRNQESATSLMTGAAEPSPLYNNCSGKHAGMLALSLLLGADVGNYLDPDHPAQRRITARLAADTGLDGDAHLGIDGCSAPTLHAPLASMARAFARHASAMLDPGSAAARIGRAMARCPEMLGEDEDFNVVLLRVLGHRLIGKYGAEGLFCVAVPERQLGIAVRIEDGAPRAIGPVVLHVLLDLGIIREQELGPLARFHAVTLTNWRGTEIGVLRPEVVLSRTGEDPPDPLLPRVRSQT